MGVLHHHRLGSGQSVRDAVLVFVAYGLMGQKDAGSHFYFSLEHKHKERK